MILTPFTNHDELHQYNQNYTRNNSRVKQTHLQKCKFQVHQFLSNLYIINISPSEQQKCSVHELRYESSQQPFAHLKHHRSVKEIRSQFTSLKGKKNTKKSSCERYKYPTSFTICHCLLNFLYHVFSVFIKAL